MKWHKMISREGVDPLSIGMIDAVFMKEAWRLSTSPSEVLFTWFENRRLTHYIATDFQKVGQNTGRRFFSRPQHVQRLYKQGIILLRNIAQSTRPLSTLPRPTSLELFTFLRLFRKQYIVVNERFSIGPWIALEAWQNDVDTTIQQLLLQRSLEHRSSEIIAALTRPWRTTALQHLANRALHGASHTTLARDFQFLRSWAAVWYQPLTAKWVQTSLGDQRTRQHRPHLTYRQAIVLLKPNDKQRRLLQFAPYATFFKDWRDDLRRTFVYQWSPIFDHLAIHLKISRDDLGYFLLDEIEEFLETKTRPDYRLVARRKRWPFVITATKKDQRVQIIQGGLGKYRNIRTTVEAQQTQKKIHGFAAYLGLVRGRVTIVKNAGDLHHVRRGDILVAGTTHPNYLPAMRVASAFVTDEGGIVSHAAIVAREMKKPCIVGTKVATKVLKDGDRVEVDATRGIVRKL